MSKNSENVHKVRQKKRLLVDAFKVENGCCVCGFNESARSLDFHHTDPSVKVDTIAMLITNNRSMLKIWTEIEKCVIVCANHHRMLHAGEITIPKI